jgi:hypothetical protein
MVDSDEEYQAGRSWLSLKGLQQAADLKSVFKLESSPSASLNSSISTEQPANADIRSSPFFIGLGKSTKQRRDSSISRQQTQRRGEGSSELAVELSKAQHEVSRLNCEVIRLRQDQKLQLQEVSSACEDRVQRLKGEVEMLTKRLKEANDRRGEEVRTVRAEYERRIENMKVEHAKENQKAVEIMENLHKSALKDLENRYLAKSPAIPSLENVDISRFRRVPKQNSGKSDLSKAVSKADTPKFEGRDTLEADQTANLKVRISSIPRQWQLEAGEDQENGLEGELKQLIQRIE